MSEAEAIKTRINKMIQTERERCRRRMGDAAWAQHEAWVTEHIVASAKEWIFAQLLEGRF
ncbi:hypothetical protein [Burkholderia sp. Tr-20390]|uniref:hypothetical protein n=1 Tax=Burkholderia sp. Tr-20390 TaxID=2703904 RepID=UPI00197D252C|nr:hypothetical protein [Burkholderia sp. Tr-20390]MBN3730906.1 hypothetical protein [Burkholderia sp. Tr-20390]